jgi:hypothetical protein
MPAETENQKRVREKLDEFIATFKGGAALAAYLTQNQVKIVEALKRENRKWRLIGVLPDHVRSVFDIQGDVLIMAASYDQLQPRILSEMQGDISEDTRFDKDLCFLATTDRNATKLTDQRRGELAVLTVNPNMLQSASAPNLKELIAGLLGIVDHYNVTTPITAAPAFFGRTRMIRDITKELELGTHVGVFGLRKAGKSSLLAQVRTALAQQGWGWAWLDLGQYVGSAHRLVLDLVVEIAKQLGYATRLNKSSSRENIESHWRSELSEMCQVASLDKRLLVVLDEFDLATPGAAFATERDAFELIATLSKLRGALQQLQANGHATPMILAAGINPNLVELAHLYGRPNPLFQFLRIHYIEPLDREELAKMVRTLGKKTGLKFTDARTIDELQAEYGGHPLLSRQACSFVHNHRNNQQVPYDVTMAELVQAFGARGSNTPLHHAGQAAAEFIHIFPEEGRHVRDAVTNKRGVVDLGVAMHARAYGLVNDAGQISLRALLRDAVLAEAKGS